MLCLYLRLAQSHQFMPTSTILAHSSVPSGQQIYSETGGTASNSITTQGRCTLPNTAHTDGAGTGTTPARNGAERVRASELYRRGGGVVFARFIGWLGWLGWQPTELPQQARQQPAGPQQRVARLG